MNYFTKYSKTIGKTIAIITKIQITDAILFWFLRLKKFIVTSCLSPVQPHPRCKLVGSAVGLQAEKGICDHHEYYTYIFCPLHCIHNLCASQDETRGKKTPSQIVCFDPKIPEEASSAATATPTAKRQPTIKIPDKRLFLFVIINKPPNSHYILS